MKTIQIKRIYEEASPDDGYRILVDRLWPRGISKIRAKLDEWNKEIAPSTEIRKWFDHQPERFDEFSELYKEELNDKKEELKRIQTIAEKQKITLLYGARDPKINHVIILLEVLTKSK
ncbi:MAG TPA: DUF488 domain-containing protein [Moheibacter sp.]|nr:DUF488 domain-containing protein [Moheibacter sp.]